MYGRLTSLPKGSRLKTNGSLVRLPYTGLQTYLEMQLGVALPNHHSVNPKKILPTLS